MAEDVKDTEVETEKNETMGTEEVQEGAENAQEKITLKMVKEKIDGVYISLKEQGEKTATKKDVWKAALTNATIIIGTIVVGAVFGV